MYIFVQISLTYVGGGQDEEAQSIGLLLLWDMYGLLCILQPTYKSDLLKKGVQNAPQEICFLKEYVIPCDENLDVILTCMSTTQHTCCSGNKHITPFSRHWHLDIR